MAKSMGRRLAFGPWGATPLAVLLECLLFVGGFVCCCLLFPEICQAKRQSRIASAFGTSKKAKTAQDFSLPKPVKLSGKVELGCFEFPPLQFRQEGCAALLLSRLCKCENNKKQRNTHLSMELTLEMGCLEISQAWAQVYLQKVFNHVFACSALKGQCSRGLPGVIFIASTTPVLDKALNCAQGSIRGSIMQGRPFVFIKRVRIGPV